jgi:chitinase
MHLQLHQMLALGAALMAIGTSAAPMTIDHIQQSEAAAAAPALAPLQYRSGGGNAQARFLASKRDVNRKPSQALEAVINYVKRHTSSDNVDQDGYEGNLDDDADEDDGSHPSHYYQPIGRRDAGQKPLMAVASVCAAAAKTTTTATTTKTTTTTAAPTSTKSTDVKIVSTTTSKPAASATGVKTGKSGAGLVAGYWPSWAVSTLPPESIAWSKFDIVYYAFAVPTSSGSITIDDSKLLKRFVKAAQAGNTKAVLSLGGWGQSTGFSQSVRTDAARAKFITSVVNVISTYNLDGVDFDWEYPGDTQGGPSDPSDTKNFQTFVQQLRAKIGSGKLLSAAVPQQVWQGSNGNPVGSVARAGAALDHIVIMNYDVWGSSKDPGPNAPLANLCGNSTQPTANAAGGVKAWTSAGFPREKIILGVPSYGYINSSTKRRLRQRSLDPVLIPDRADGPEATFGNLARRAALKSMDGTTTSGQINFNSLVAQGALVLNSNTGNYDAGSGYTKYWDDCSDTPYLATGSIVVTYDDPDSLYDKADFAHLAGIAGVAMWSIDGDTTGNVLINSMIAGLQG